MGLTTLVEDLSWCWWTRPRAVQLGGQLYVGGIDSAGDVVVATWRPGTASTDPDATAGVTHSIRIATLEPDDHNNPAILVTAGRPALAFYARHEQDGLIRYRASAAPLDVTAWSPERSIRFPGLTTYAQVHPYGRSLHLLTRVDSTSWGYCRSADWAATWEPPGTLVALDTDQETYLASTLLADGRTLRVAIAGHPKEYERRPVHDVFTFLADLATGDVTLPGKAGQPIANLYSGAGLPLTEDRLECVFRSPADRTLNFFDISDGPDPEIAFVSKVKDDNSTRDARYHVSRLTRDGWRTDDLVAAGGLFGYIHAGFYAGGMAFPPRTPGGRVLLSREHDGQWSLEEWSRSGAGWTGRALAPPGPGRIVRPWGVAGPAGYPDVVGLVLDDYGDDYLRTRSHLVGVRSSAPA